jgi:hypothetical protein
MPLLITCSRLFIGETNMKLKQTLIAVALSSSVATTGMAAPQLEHLDKRNNNAAIVDLEKASLIADFSASDLSLVFEQDATPLQLAGLTEQEMKDTEGAWLFNFLGGFAGGLSSAYGYFAATPRYQASWGGALRSFGGGAFAGAINPIRGFGGLTTTVFGGFGGSYISNRSWGRGW